MTDRKPPAAAAGDATGARGGDAPGARPSAEPDPAGAHPRGTLAIVGIYGLLFALGWAILYFFVFLPRGTITP